jgi:hypothetical protein
MHEEKYETFMYAIDIFQQGRNKMAKIDNAPTTNALEFKGKFLVGSIHKKTGAVSFSVSPARHETQDSACHEAARLAGQCAEKHYMVVNVTDIATQNTVVFL